MSSGNSHYGLQVTGQTFEVRGSRLEAMSINMFEVEGWRLKAKVKKTFCLKPQACPVEF